MNLLVVDDYPVIRSGIKSMLLKEEKSYSIYEASNVKEALQILRREPIDLAMVDLRLGDENGIDIIKASKAQREKVKYIILTSFISEFDFITAENIGVDGYILKDALIEDIIYAINTTMRGRKYYDPSIVANTTKAKENSLLSKLTPRELDILMEISKGDSNNDIAKKFFLSESTVKKHVSSILSKLNLSKRSEIVYMINHARAGEVVMHNE